MICLRQRCKDQQESVTAPGITSLLRVRYFVFFIMTDESPAPNSYSQKSIFINTPSSKAFSFGIAREAYSKVYIKEHPARDPNVPGPG